MPRSFEAGRGQPSWLLVELSDKVRNRSRRMGTENQEESEELNIILFTERLAAAVIGLALLVIRMHSSLMAAITASLEDGFT